MSTLGKVPSIARIALFPGRTLEELEGREDQEFADAVADYNKFSATTMGRMRIRGLMVRSTFASGARCEMPVS